MEPRDLILARYGPVLGSRVDCRIILVRLYTGARRQNRGGHSSGWGMVL